MHYLLKGIGLMGALVLPTLIWADPLERNPLHVTFSPNQLQGENYVWQIVQTVGGQMIVGGERLGFYQDNHWEFLAEPRRSAIRGLLIDGNELWVSSLNEIGSVSLPLSPNSRFRPLAVPELTHAGDIWHLAKSGDLLVATTNEEVWFIDPQHLRATHTKLPNKGHLVLFSWEEKLVVSQPDVALWEVADGQLRPLENPLPNRRDSTWIWTNSTFVLTTQALYKKEATGYRVVSDTKALNDTGAIASAAVWEKSLVVATLTKGLVSLDLENGNPFSVTNASGLPAVPQLVGHVDAAGRLWVGSGQGIVVLEATRFGHSLATSSPVRFANRDGGLFVSYEDHAEFFHDDGVQEKFSRTYQFLRTRHGPVLGSFGKIKIGKQEILTPGNRIGVMIELPSGNLLVTAGERIYFVEPTSAKSTLIDGPTTEVTGLACIGDTLWAATVDGTLYRVPVVPPFTFSKSAGRSNATYATLHALGKTLIVSSREGVHFGEQFREVENTRDVHRQFLAENADGVWLVGEQDGERRLGRLVQHNGSVAWETVEAKGLAQLSEVHSLTGSGHTLILCGNSTILELNSDQFAPVYRLAAPHLRFTFHDPVTKAPVTRAAPPAELSADNNSVTFAGTLAFDEFGERPRFERRLLPTETEWIATKPGENVSYPSLSARDYTLEVRTTHLGHTGPATAYRFTVLPPWYATGTAIAGYVALAAVGFFGIYRLRTRQIRRRTAELERIVEERTHALKEASAAKTEFLASMSHEIRNPMNGVIGLVDILREQPALPRQADTLRLLHHCADQLRTTVDDILDFSKIEAGRIELEAVAFDLRDTLEAAAVTIDPTGEKISFIDKPPHGVALVGDVGKLRQIYANYLSNALKYGVPPAARVSLLLTPIPGDGLRLTLGVASSGPTIPKDTLDKFFDSFTRGTEAIERNIHGTGLGLAICRKFAQAMDGEVGAVSANGETTFYINVPFARATPDALTPAAATTPNTLPAKALAIEDEDYNRIVLGSILAKMNYTVDWATTGAEALKLAQENGYDIILTDYRLPDTNGVELTKKILQFCPDPKPAVFAVTAYSTKERRDECLNAGMVGFISKPITLEKLRSTLAGWGEKNLAKISLEAGRQLGTVFTAQPPADIAAAWDELQRTVPIDAKKAADLAHRLNNLCRAHGLIDVAEQLELLEGALERGEPAAPFLRAGEALLRD